MTKVRVTKPNNFFERFFDVNDPHRTLVDQVSSSTYIVGRAVARATELDFAWQIFQIDLVGEQQQVTYAADGEARFRWVDRELVLDPNLPDDGSPAGIFLTNDNVDAGSVAGTVIGELYPKALDVGTESYAFAITNDPSNKFQLNPAVNNLLVLTDTALAVDDFYLVDILVVDSQGRSYSEQLTIDVVSLRLTNDEVPEGASIGTKIADIVTVEGTSPFTYAIVADPDDKFQITGDALEVKNPLDFETAEFHSVTIQSTDALLQVRQEVFTITVLAETISLFASVITQDKDSNDAVRAVIANPEEICQKGIQYDLADGTVSAIKAVYKTINGVAPADKDISFATSTVVGISITGNTTGNQVKYKVDGILEDSSFNFPINDQLYLGNNGNITNVPPTTGQRTLIGTSCGVGAINVNIQEPIIL